MRCGEDARHEVEVKVRTKRNVFIPSLLNAANHQTTTRNTDLLILPIPLMPIQKQTVDSNSNSKSKTPYC